MKRIALIILISVICLNISAFAEITDETVFSTILLSYFDYNAKEWMQDESSRALFAVCAMTDYLSIEKSSYDTDNIVNGSLYIGRSSFLISLAYNDPEKNNSLIITMDTRDKEEATCFIVPLDKNTIEYGIDNASPDGYYKVDIADFYDALQIISGDN